MIVKDDTEGGYVVSNPDLPGCITYGDTIESALANAVDARKAWIAASIEGNNSSRNSIDK